MDKMRVMLVTMLCLFGLGPVRSQSEIPQERLQLTLLEGAKFSLKNLSDKSLTACVYQLSLSSETKPHLTVQWDSLVQNIRPIAPGESMVQSLGHVLGGPIPDKVEVLAGVWEDGETLGDPLWIKRVLSARQAQASAYGLAISLLQRGVEQDWTVEQYREELRDKPNSQPFDSLRSTLDANERISAQRPATLRHTMQRMLDLFKGRYEGFQRAKPSVETVP
jgi:hypothetical protein